MSNIMRIVAYSFFSGITVFLGALASRWFEKHSTVQLSEKVVHSVVAFGGGVLVAAVAFVLAPKGIEALTYTPLILLFLGGAGTFAFLDAMIKKQGGTLAQLMVMMMDFIPEAIALGAVFAHNQRYGLLLALFIGLQNFPEAFNGYLDLRKTGYSPNKCVWIMFPLSFFGIAAALAGSYWLSGNPEVIASLMLFSGGGDFISDISGYRSGDQAQGTLVGTACGEFRVFSGDDRGEIIRVDSSNDENRGREYPRPRFFAYRAVVILL